MIRRAFGNHLIQEVIFNKSREFQRKPRGRTGLWRKNSSCSHLLRPWGVPRSVILAFHIHCIRIATNKLLIIPYSPDLPVTDFSEWHHRFTFSWITNFWEMFDTLAPQAIPTHFRSLTKPCWCHLLNIASHYPPSSLHLYTTTLVQVTNVSTWAVT